PPPPPHHTPPPPALRAPPPLRPEADGGSCGANRASCGSACPHRLQRRTQCIKRAAHVAPSYNHTPFKLRTTTSMDDTFRQAALDYHRLPKPGKISVTPTKSLITQRDLGLAYSPGVAAACEEIVADPSRTREYTARGNLIGVITNGTAVLGLGAIGPEAAKPVMEGKGVLFKKFAGIDVFD